MSSMREAAYSMVEKVSPVSDLNSKLISEQTSANLRGGMIKKICMTMA